MKLASPQFAGVVVALVAAALPVSSSPRAQQRAVGDDPPTAGSLSHQGQDVVPPPGVALLGGWLIQQTIPSAHFEDYALAFASSR